MDVTNLEQSILESNSTPHSLCFNSILEKERLLRKRMDAEKCFINKTDIYRKQIRLRECSIRLKATTKEVLSQLIKTNETVHSLRRENVQELFEKYLPIKASVCVYRFLFISSLKLADSYR